MTDILARTSFCAVSLGAILFVSVPTMIHAAGTRWALPGQDSWEMQRPSSLRDSSEQVSTTGQLNAMRRLLVLDPERAALVGQQLIAPNDRKLINRLRILDPQVISSLDSLAHAVDNTPFLAGNALISLLLDSLRSDVFDGRTVLSGDRLAHFNTVSRTADGRPFLQGHPDLMSRLESERRRFFRSPDSFSGDRLEQLDRISLLVTSLPFLRGNPGLIAALERARMEYSESRLRFDPDRLGQLDGISRSVTGRPFQGRENRTVLVTLLIVLVVGLVAVVIRLVQTRSAPRSGAIPMRTDSRLSFRVACAVMGLNHDYSEDELNRAFRDLQKKYHPDLVAQLGVEIRETAERKSREINAAYNVLKSEIREQD